MKKFVLLALLPLSATGDMISPSHNCSKPVSVSHFATEGERASYQRQLTSYKQCLSNFINEQNKEARLHSEAARMAGNELQEIGR